MRRVDLSGRYLIPGLVDVHAHLSILEYADRFPRPEHGAEPLLPNLAGHVVAQTLRDCLRMGVTTVRDVGAYGDTVLEARQAMRYGVFAGPRLDACGRIVSATAPAGGSSRGCTARQTVRTTCAARSGSSSVVAPT